MASAAAGSSDVQTVQTVQVVAVSPAVKAVAGSLGGVVEACLLQPIDVAKTRLQLDKSGQYKGGWAGGRMGGACACVHMCGVCAHRTAILKECTGKQMHT